MRFDKKVVFEGFYDKGFDNKDKSFDKYIKGRREKGGCKYNKRGHYYQKGWEKDKGFENI